ncbi:hypothetical protein [Caenimonas sp. SL110]|uniref:hypothetical protein n=1 Tax=Caenimonas sp. SL110 TaxID=1450524 RepID=UPI00128BA444|nr:hypothetical protein [Caenimonas sp. SL110]
MTLQQDELAAPAVRVHFHDVPNDALSLLPPMLTHGEARSLAQTSTRLSLVVSGNRAFSLTRQSLNTGLLAMTRSMMMALRRHEQAAEASTAPHRDQLFVHGDIIKFWADMEQAPDALDRVGHDAAMGQLKTDLKPSNHMTPAREAEVRAILNIGPAHKKWLELLNECEGLLVQFDAGQFTPDARHAACQIHAKLGYDLMDRDFFKLRLDPANGLASNEIRQMLIDLRLDVLDKAAKAIIALEAARST